MALNIIAGGMYGSEAKGAVTAVICAEAAREGHPVTVVRTGGPNAGHSAADPTGRIWPLRQIPAGLVADHLAVGVVASGSEIDVEVLESEIAGLEAGGIEVAARLVISDAATIVEADHRHRETELVAAIGSTGKGIGAARADRIMRTARTARNHPALRPWVKPAADIERMLNHDARHPDHLVVIEGTQGYGLGLHTKHYPQVTSGDCRAVDFCAAAGINPWGVPGLQIHLVIRPYPIRVAGNSGPLKDETTWEDLGLRPELTTVTRKVRRVGLYDRELVGAAIQANSPNVRLAVSMVDQVPDAVKDGRLTEVGERFITDIALAHSTPVRWYGIGPALTDWHRWS